MSDQDRLNIPATSPKKLVNPLLSASVIGSASSSTALLLPPEPKSLVTVGESSVFDSENLDEINLSPVPENLGPPAIIDTNSNAVLEENIQNDSLLSQAASSFSALPSVASNVFSTFSKRIYAGSSREQTPFSDNVSYDVNSNPSSSPLASYPQSQLPEKQQEFSSTFFQPLNSLSTEQTSSNSLQNTFNENLQPEPPKLYSPTDLPTILSVSKSVCPPPPLPVSGAQNSYRLTAKKKLYAPIPGLSGQPQPIQTLKTNSGEVATQNSDFFSNVQHPPQSNIPDTACKQEERKGGLFSLTNFVSTGVLQNISGLVQTAAGTLSSSVKSEEHKAIPVLDTSSQTFLTSVEPTTNFFGPPPSNLHQAPTETKLVQPITTATSVICEASINTSSVPLLNSSIPTANLSTKDVNFFNPNFVSNPGSSETLHNTPQIQSNQSASSAPPPTSGNTSFRLQKGTRLYKSPLVDSTENSSVYLIPQQQELHPQAVLNYNTSSFFVPPLPDSQDIKQEPTIFKPPIKFESPANQKTSEGLTKPVFGTKLSTEKQPTTVTSSDQNTNQVVETKVFQSKLGEQSTSANTPLAEESDSIQVSGSNTPIISSVSNLNSDLLSSTINTTNSSTNVLLPPPVFSNLPVQKTGNPYRKGPTDTTHGEVSSKVQTSLASFFNPNVPSGDNLSSDLALADNSISQSTFGVVSNKILESSVKENQENLAEREFPVHSNSCTSTISSFSETEIQQEPSSTSGLPPPIGFENLVSNTKQADIALENNKSAGIVNFSKENISEQAELSNNSCSKLFWEASNKTENKSEVVSLEKQINFFDSFSTPKNESNDSTSSTQLNYLSNSNEDQKIQNFFNNPPPKENGSELGDLNYDLVHSGLGVRSQHTGSLTTASNIVEPPSSACSEFSELNPEFNQRLAGVENKAELRALKSKEASALKDSYSDLPESVLKELRMSNEKGTSTTALTAMVYTPAIKHWFYNRLVGQKHIWTPFSHFDSALLETALTTDHASNIVSVEGGRYDVNITERIKTPVYWEGIPVEVRRCSWFYKASDSKYVPYEEDIADRLEEVYRQAAESGVWHKKILIANNEQVVFHGPSVIVHFQQQQNVDAWGGTSQTTSRPRIVKRDLDDFAIEQGESERVDHLLLMVHGIGSACDLKMRSVEEVVDDFRSIAQNLVQSHYKNSADMGIVGRVEVLPISWHSHLHSEEMGIDEKLKSITLESIPKLRNFTNDTLLDILFYTSPTYCQKIITTVANAMNTLYIKYRERHPDFSGGVSLAGHSLGSLILFDLLCHQQPAKECEDQNMENPNQIRVENQFSGNNAVQPPVNNVTSQQISYSMGPAGTGQPYIQYAQLVFHPKKFFAFGSPIGMFVTIRGIDKLGLDFRLPTCPGFYNIFHPFDPVAYRIEALVNPDLSGIRPVLIPHHKGRKRMHLELKETMTRVGADLKQRFMETFKNTLDSVNFMGTARSKREAEEIMEKDVDQVIAMQIVIEKQQEASEQDLGQTETEIPIASARSRANSASTTHSDIDIIEVDFPLGKLNDSKRIDYVLQEAPLEFINEYLFALSSHVCYWDSSDTILFVMKEIYSGMGISPDNQIPQQSMTIERPSSRNSVSHLILPPTV